MTSLPAPAYAITNGTGSFPADCGTSTLWVGSVTRDFKLKLQSNDGDILSGWYVIWTTGAFSIPNAPGGFKIDGTTAVAIGTVEFPGAFPGSAVVTGSVNTIEGSCLIAVTAPGTPGI